MRCNEESDKMRKQSALLCIQERKGKQIRTDFFREKRQNNNNGVKESKKRDLSTGFKHEQEYNQPLEEKE